LQPVSPFETGIATTAPSVAATLPAFARQPAVPVVQAPASPAVVAPTVPAAVSAPQVVVIDNGSRGEPVIRVENASRVASIQPTPIAVPTPVSAQPAAMNWMAGQQLKPLVPVKAPGTAAPASVALTSHESSVLVPAGSSKSSPTPIAVTSPVAGADHEARYGHAPDYSRLRGKLEYSATRKQWKLRYIPVDAAGSSDTFGGSVVLTDLGDMSQFHDGDFAVVEGKVNDRADGAKDFAPDYQVRRILK
jgi:hypothetical protein